MVFRTFVFAAFTLIAAVSVAAQEPTFFTQAVAVHGPGMDAVPEEIIQKAKAALNLSDVQVTAMKTLLNMRNESTKQIFEEILAAQKKLQDAAAQPNANATEVGQAFLTVQTAHQRLKAVMDKFRTDFAALLNAEQRATLSRLNAATEQIASLRALGVLEGGEMAMPMPMPMGPMPMMHFGSVEAGYGAAIRIERPVSINK